VQEQVQCAMEVGAFTLGVAVRVNLTFGCAVGEATHGNVGGTLEASRDLCGSVAGGKGGLWMVEAVGSRIGHNGGRGKAAGMECMSAKMRRYGGVEEGQCQWGVALPNA
jgi:hypothetical protein